MLSGALLVLVTGVIHLHLWLIGYRRVATVGPLFLIQSITSVVLAIGIAVTRRLVSALVGAGFLLATAGGLLLSATVGFLGFHDGFDAPWAGVSLIVEGTGAAVLFCAVAVLARLRRAYR